MSPLAASFFARCSLLLYIKDNVDIYITGSNSYLLSSDLATLLSGRYVEISLLPLSFKEFNELQQVGKEDSFARYMQIGGFPYVTMLDSDNIDFNLEGIYNTVVVKDIEDRQNRKDVNKIKDVSLLKDVSKYLQSIIGSPVSVRGIANYLTSNGRKVSPNAIDNYVSALCESYIFYRVQPMDISGKELLNSPSKFYTVDLGLRNYILPKKDYDLGFSIENIIYFELLRRGYKVNVGRINNVEIDFVAKKRQCLYVFSSYS